MLAQLALHGRARHAEQVGELGGGALAGLSLGDDLGALGGGEARPAPQARCRPALRAWVSPFMVRSRIMARSNPANAPSICVVNRSDAVVVSIASVTDRNIERWRTSPALSLAGAKSCVFDHTGWRVGTAASSAGTLRNLPHQLGRETGTVQRPGLTLPDHITV